MCWAVFQGSPTGETWAAIYKPRLKMRKGVSPTRAQRQGEWLWGALLGPRLLLQKLHEARQDPNRLRPGSAHPPSHSAYLGDAGSC